MSATWNRSRKSKVVLLTAVEYLSERGENDGVGRKGPVLYVGVRQRSSDGHPCLVVRTPGAGRNFNIPISCLYAITRGEMRHQIQSPPADWRGRLEELRRLTIQRGRPKPSEVFSAEAFLEAHSPAPHGAGEGPRFSSSRRSGPGLYGAVRHWLHSTFG